MNVQEWQFAYIFIIKKTMNSSKEDTVPVYKLTTSENGREMLFTNVGEVRRS